MINSHVATRAIALALALAMGGCGGEAGDANSEKLQEQAAGTQTPQRIISLIPSVTETIVALGATDRLVARSQYDVDPRLDDLPSVGQGLTPSLEQLARLEPDLVVAWPDNPMRSVIARLEELGVSIYSPEVQTLDDMRETARDLGAMLGLETRADSLIATIDQELDEIRQTVAGRPRPSVFYVVWYAPPTTSGSGTYIDELIEIAGGQNIFADAPGLWPQVSLEEAVRRQPDIILLSKTREHAPDIGRLRDEPGWRQLDAIQRGDVVQVDANLYNRPGPRVVRAARELAHLLHPEAFQANSPR
ncbi:MAG: cobalamin-binding protein [Gemmatimonadetes bacterium]|uniref:Cobalamin-binding protein n=1 Tax=Candidatus Kutchimonas denitrificans TaxID=3056748 RepID=A0AAE4ZAT0_9BACT|nr:cobalamin-binding protein [Gemmatimonadota bacterium]NIR74005.1 cobalamin-binding protein [Candidatus Kutchimonas denitrificans]NIS02994.1 cobalamin-binding protein [Gemmatimonadota bacterium]NIT68711.1 cobalamin-binding protein [Gemmatimonadota bacterium]NIU53292.1 ABC transporter substrate-binding protein [Gemmatimonadota bacterium]